MSFSHLEEAREKLNPNNLESGLPGRESQVETIYNFLFQRLKVKATANARRAKVASGQVANIKNRHGGKTMFICGVPGTGKTASVINVLHKLSKLKDQANSPIHDFVHVYINGQHLPSPDKIYSEICLKLCQKNFNPEKAQCFLEKIFKPDQDRPGPNSYKVLMNQFKLIVVDELDLLYNEKREQILYNLFDWPTSAESKVILIAIANAMDLPERMQNKVSSRLGWEKLVFEPYRSDSLETILRVRLGESLLKRCFDTTSISVATKKIGRTTGDARRILDVCRQAITLAIRRKLKQVNARIIDEVGFEKLELQRREYISTCGPFHLLVLKSIFLEAKSQKDEIVETYGVYQQLCTLMQRTEMFKNTVVTTRFFDYILLELAAVSMIHMDMEKPIMKRPVYLKDPNEITHDLIKNEPIKYS